VMVEMDDEMLIVDCQVAQCGRERVMTSEVQNTEVPRLLYSIH